MAPRHDGARALTVFDGGQADVALFADRRQSHADFVRFPALSCAYRLTEPSSRSFLKDLATIRDPTSPYTFLNYLASQNRLVTYINRSTFSPTRREYSDYMAWVATQVVDNAKASGDLMTGIVVHFGESVDHVEVVLDADAASDARLLRVCSKNVATGQRVTRLCRNLIVSPGGVPALPAQFRAGELKGHPGILHTSQYLDRIDDLLDDLFPTSPSTIQGAQSQSRSRSRARPHLRPTSTPPSLASPSPPEREGAAASSMERGPSAGSVVASLTSALHRQASLARGVRIAVVGGGQSSAETFLETRNRISALTAQRAGVDAPRPQIDLIIRRANLYPSDDSPFSNEVFDPTSTDYYYSLGSVTTPGQDGEGKGQAKSARQHVLGEAKSTNYAVVNPTTLDNVSYRQFLSYARVADVPLRAGLRGHVRTARGRGHCALGPPGCLVSRCPIGRSRPEAQHRPTL